VKSKGTVLVVDDDKRNVRLIKSLLMPEGYHLLSAESGETALEAVARERPDLVLLDVVMPGMDGFEVCQRLKSGEGTRDIPVVMVTALQSKEDRVKALRLGADDFLSKPVDKAELQARVKSLLRIKAYHDSLVESNREIREKNEKLAELERLKDELTHMLVHDLGNPLAAVCGGVETVLDMGENLDPSQVKFLEISLRCSLELRSMVDNLLDIHRMEQGRLKPDFGPVNLVDTAAEAGGSFEANLRRRSVAYEFEGEPGLPDVRADPALLRRVISNILANAIRHTPDNGSIRLSVAAEGESFLALSIRDSGDGLEPGVEERIFDKFEQAKIKNEGKMPQGCGLGLAFCRMAVEAQGGRIEARSDGEGLGCEFRFTIPVWAAS